MSKACRKLRMWTWLVSPAVIFSLAHHLALAQKQPASNEPSSVAWKAPSEGKPADYVGTETCAASGCHVQLAKQFAKTVHARAEIAGIKYGTGCESCHGPQSCWVSPGEPFTASCESTAWIPNWKAPRPLHTTPEADDSPGCSITAQSSKSVCIYLSSQALKFSMRFSCAMLEQSLGLLRRVFCPFALFNKS